MNITIEPGASALLDALHRAGFAAYAVGGCVRDSLLGLAPHDWDLCTAARPEQVMELFGEKQCIPTGLQHGTVTVKRERQALRDHHLPHGGQLFRWPPPRQRGLCTRRPGGPGPAGLHHQRHGLQRRRGFVRPLWRAGKIWPGAWCGPSVSRCAALKKTLCASCVSTALRPGSVL